MTTRRPPTIQIPPKRTHGETRGRLPLIPTPEPGSIPALPVPGTMPASPGAPVAPAGIENADTAETDLDIANDDTAPQGAAIDAARALGAILDPTQRPSALLRGSAEPSLASGAPLPSLSDGAVFQTLPADRRDAVVARFQRRQIAAGMRVILQGETAHPLYVVVRGLLEVRFERASGDVIALDHIRDGDVVGEIGLLGHAPSPFQVIAATSCELMALGPKDFYDIAGAFPALWTYLKDLATRRTRDYEAKQKRG